MSYCNVFMIYPRRFELACSLKNKNIKLINKISCVYTRRILGNQHLVRRKAKTNET